MKILIIVVALIVLAVIAIALTVNKTKNMNQPASKNTVTANPNPNNEPRDTATFGGGCFWCTEALFQRLEGVDTVVSGYSGGTVKNPSYREVCTGTTGHAEVTQIVFDPKKVSYLELLKVFFKTHDPTTLNRQGNDTGTQYRSIIFYHNEEQKKVAEDLKAELDKSGAWDKRIVTEIVPFTVFYPAEDYHQNYYNLNSGASYCQYVIQPKLEKFEKVFKDKLKPQIQANPNQ